LPLDKIMQQQTTNRVSPQGYSQSTQQPIINSSPSNSGRNDRFNDGRN